VQQTCVICTEEFDAQQAILRTRACAHIFHKDCLVTWVATHLKNQRLKALAIYVSEPFCPVCRTSLSQ